MNHNSIPLKNFKFFIFGFILLTGFFGAFTVFANCTVPPGGDHTVFSSCSLAGSVNGVDNGNLIISSGVTLTINANQTIAFNPGKSITVNGTIAMSASGAQIKQSYLYMTDTDGDGYPANSNQSISSGRRRYLLTSFNVDCNDSISTAWRLRYVDGDNDGYGVGAATCVGDQTGYSDNAADCYDANANARPGSTLYDNTSRGDGSFDYNCDGVETKFYRANKVCTPALTVPASRLTGSCTAYPAGLELCSPVGDASSISCGTWFELTGTNDYYAGSLCVSGPYYNHAGGNWQACN